MPRFYFHLISDGNTISDYEGAELKSIGNAVDEAELGAREILAASIISSFDPPTMISVRDERGIEVAEIFLKSFIPSQLR